MQRRVHINLAMVLIVFTAVAGFYSLRADDTSQKRAKMSDPWKFVEFKKKDVGPLMKRLAEAGKPPTQPAAIALRVMDENIGSWIVSVTAIFDSFESPSSSTVTIEEGGISDDDLQTVRHVLGMAKKNGDKSWRIVSYEVGELRRKQLGQAGHPLFAPGK